MDDFFQASPNGLKTSDKAICGFFSLVLTYIKGAQLLGENESPKELSTLMPRTDFPTIYSQIRERIKNDVFVRSDKLYDIVKILVCYKNQGKDENLGNDGTEVL